MDHGMKPLFRCNCKEEEEEEEEEEVLYLLPYLFSIISYQII